MGSAEGTTSLASIASASGRSRSATNLPLVPPSGALILASAANDV